MQGGQAHRGRLLHGFNDASGATACEAAAGAAAWQQVSTSQNDSQTVLVCQLGQAKWRSFPLGRCLTLALGSLAAGAHVCLLLEGLCGSRRCNCIGATSGSKRH